MGCYTFRDPGFTGLADKRSALLLSRKFSKGTGKDRDFRRARL